MDAVVVAAALVAAVLLVVLVGFQIALAVGVPWGKAAYGGASETLSPRLRVSSAVAVVVWALVSWFYLALAVPDLAGPVPDSWAGVVSWILVGLFAVATLMNAISRSRIERAIWTPVSAVLLISGIVVALGSVVAFGSAGAVSGSS